MQRDPQCVFVTTDPDLANVVAATLAGEDIPAQVLDQRAVGNLFGAGMNQTGEIEVWVSDPDQRRIAAELIAAHHGPTTRIAGTVDPSNAVEIACDECHFLATFPADQFGSVQECPNCGSYMDVPNPLQDGDPTEMDVGPEVED